MDTTAYVEELRELVDIDSGTGCPAGVTSIAALMAAKFRAINWHSECVDLGPTVGKGVFATNKPGAEHYDALLLGHLDTVFPEGTVAERPMTTDALYAYGPGVADMKSGLLSMVWAFKGMDQSDLDRMAIAVALNPDEEIGSPCSKPWIHAIAKKSRYALVFEAARGEGGMLVKARKGLGHIRFTFSGVASHAGNAPDAGRSAINEMAHSIIALTGLANKDCGTTINVGLVGGGDAVNIVPDKAWCTVDVRFWQNEDYTRVENAMRVLCANPVTPDVTIAMHVEAHVPAMYPTPEMEAFMKIVEKSGEAVGVPIRWQMAGGASDANHLAPLGIPVLDGFGPTGGHAHSLKEFLELESIGPRIELLQNLLVRLPLQPSSGAQATPATPSGLPDSGPGRS